MCASTEVINKTDPHQDMNSETDQLHGKAPVDKLLEPPTILARYTCASILLALFAVWGKLTLMPEAEAPGIGSPMHSYKVPLALTIGYLVCLPLLRFFAANVLSKNVDVKLLLRESMILYNVAQVLLNGWMVCRFLKSVIFRGHPLIGDISNVASGAAYAVWVHYMDKYLEFFDTFFMVLRGKTDQVSFLHVYHHVSIAWAWWYAMYFFPGGDCYFGALLNSWIHVMMYSYYSLALLRIPCPWKKYLTQAQLLQFVSVLVYSLCSYLSLQDQMTKALRYAYIVQTGEMTSLFVLFVHFYRKAYKIRHRKSSNGEAEAVAEVSLSSTSTEENEENQASMLKQD